MDVDHWLTFTLGLITGAGLVGALVGWYLKGQAVMESYIGWWGLRLGGKWHLVESEVTDRLVMRCGRQMAMVNAYGSLSFVLEPTGERCEQCVGHRA